MDKKELGKIILEETLDKAWKDWHLRRNEKFDEKIDRIIFYVTTCQFDCIKKAFDLKLDVKNYSEERYLDFNYKNFKFTIYHNRRMNTYDFCGHSIDYIEDDDKRWAYIEEKDFYEQSRKTI